MGRALAIAGVVFGVVGVALFVLLTSAVNDRATLVLRLRSEGETVHATVAEAVEREESYRQNGQTHHRTVYELHLAGTLASGAPWTETIEVDASRFAAQPTGSSLDVVALPAEPGTFLVATEVAEADASGHDPADAVMTPVASAGAGAFAALIAFLITLRRGRRS